MPEFENTLEQFAVAKIRELEKKVEELAKFSVDILNELGGARRTIDTITARMVVKGSADRHYIDFDNVWEQWDSETFNEFANLLGWANEDEKSDSENSDTEDNKDEQ